MAKKKKKSLYRKAFLTVFVILFILQIVFLVYVYNTMLLYEKREIDNYLTDYIEELKGVMSDGKIGDKVKLNDIESPYETKSSLVDGYKELVKNKKFTYKETDEANKYDIYADNLLLFTIKLDDSKVSKRLGLLKIVDWKVKDIKSYSESGIYSYDLYVTNDYKVSINGMDILKDDLVETTKIDEISSVYKDFKAVKINHYKLKNLSLEPEIRIVNKNNDEVEIESKEDGLYALNIKKYDDIKDVKDKLGSFNPMKVLETWSLLLTNDSTLAKMSEYVIRDSSMYKKAKSWVTGVDRWFTPPHYSKKNLFTEESLKNFTFYGNNVFSVEAELTKTVYLKANNEERVTKVHEMLYFAKHNGEYKLIDMKSMGK